MNNNTNQMSQNFGQWLLEQRLAKDLTQEQLAKKAGLSKSYIGHLENQRPHTTTGAIPQPLREKVIQLAKGLGVSDSLALTAAGYSTDSKINAQLLQQVQLLSEQIEDFPEDQKQQAIAEHKAITDFIRAKYHK